MAKGTDAARSGTRRLARRRTSGFTLIELVIAVGIVGLLSAIAGTNYFQYIEKARATRAIADIKNISISIDASKIDDDGIPPASLSDVQDVPPIDPWGRAYQYLKIAGTAPKKGATPVRKDRFLVPLNTDYDLYSFGPDGRSKPPLSAPESTDDIVRANNGGYIGLAEYY